MFQTNEAIALRSRYRDAYRVQNTLVTVSVVVKVLSVVGGGWVLLLSIIIPTNSGEISVVPNFVLLALSGVLSAVGLGLMAFGFIWGVLIACQAQSALAALDSAVCSSPFLTPPEVAVVMGISRSLNDPIDSVRPWPPPPHNPVAHSQIDPAATRGSTDSTNQSLGSNLLVQGWKCICGHINSEAATECPNCKRSREAKY